MFKATSDNAPEKVEVIGKVITPAEEAVIEEINDLSAGAGKPKELDYSYTQNRELSWLQFDRRVLEEALDPSVPLLERMKFISIFCTNLDEFFMVRVGSLMDLSIIAPDIRENKTNMTPREQLEAIFAAVKPLVKERDEIYAQVAAGLKQHGFKELDLELLSKKDRKFARDYYREYIRPVLSPQVVDERHPFPHLRNKELYIATLLTEEDGSQHLGIVPVPENIAPIVCDPEEPLHFVRAEKLIAMHVKKIFDIYETSEPCIISVTRNADISFDEEKFADDEGDYRLHVSRLLKKRNRLNPVRLEIEGKPEKTLLAGLLKRLKLTKNQAYVYNAPINLGWVFSLERRVGAKEGASLCYDPFVPRASEEFDLNRSIIKQVEERDRLLFYPYDSIDPFLRMLAEAATDPDVLSIKITVYRLASESRVAQHLAEAAENGKEVTVLMELRARFDEANNIDWSGRLEEAGCNIIYGMENYKCHSKVCLITKRSDAGVTYITQIGTGNYNEKTARLYTDLSLMTADQQIGEDAVTFFQNMLIGNLNGFYRKLLVAPVAIKRAILKLIDREIAKGPDGLIILKCNSLTERDIIDRLAKASQAGVQVRMNIRGICCMLPGIEGKTDNVHVRSVVGQFLEHSRIFVFGDGDDMRMYVGSADLMTRNLVHRVEVAVPITTRRAREAIMVYLDKIFEDNVKARTLEPYGEYTMVREGRDRDLCPVAEDFSVQDWCVEHPLQGVKRELSRKPVVSARPVHVDEIVETEGAGVAFDAEDVSHVLRRDTARSVFEDSHDEDLDLDHVEEVEVRSIDGDERHSDIAIVVDEPSCASQADVMHGQGDDLGFERMLDASDAIDMVDAVCESIRLGTAADKTGTEKPDEKPRKKKSDKKSDKKGDKKSDKKSGKKGADESSGKDDKKHDKKADKKAERDGGKDAGPVQERNLDFLVSIAQESKADEPAEGPSTHVKDDLAGSVPELSSSLHADAAPLETRGTEERLARERAFASGAPHTPPKAQDVPQEHKLRPEDDPSSEEYVPKHLAPEKKKSLFQRLFG